MAARSRQPGRINPIRDPVREASFAAHSLMVRGASAMANLVLSAQSIVVRQAASLISLTAGASQALYRRATGNLGFFGLATMWKDLTEAGSGTSFPVGPNDGQLNCRTDHDDSWFKQDSGRSKWLSIEDTFTAEFDSGTSEVNTYLWMGRERCTDTYGVVLPFNCTLYVVASGIPASSSHSVEIKKWDGSSTTTEHTLAFSSSTTATATSVNVNYDQGDMVMAKISGTALTANHVSVIFKRRV